MIMNKEDEEDKFYKLFEKKVGEEDEIEEIPKQEDWVDWIMDRSGGILVILILLFIGFCSSGGGCDPNISDCYYNLRRP